MWGGGGGRERERERQDSWLSALTSMISQLGGLCEPCYLSKFRRRRSRPSFDLYFHSGFHFLLFSVRRTRSFSSHVTKRTKGPLSRAETRILILRRVQRTRKKKEKKRKRLDSSRTFIRYSIFMRLLSNIHPRALRSKGESHRLVYREFYRRQTLVTIAEQTIRANNTAEKATRPLQTRLRAPSPLFLFHRRDKQLGCVCLVTK